MCNFQHGAEGQGQGPKPFFNLITNINLLHASGIYRITDAELLAYRRCLFVDTSISCDGSFFAKPGSPGRRSIDVCPNASNNVTDVPISWPTTLAQSRVDEYPCAVSFDPDSKRTKLLSVKLNRCPCFVTLCSSRQCCGRAAAIFRTACRLVFGRIHGQVPFSSDQLSCLSHPQVTSGAA